MSLGRDELMGWYGMIWDVWKEGLGWYGIVDR
jgi:hypothetical protein